MIRRNNVRLGDLLIQEGILTQEQLMAALSIQKENGQGKKIGEVLIEEGYVSSKEVSIALSRQLDIEFVDLFAQQISIANLKKFNFARLQAANAIPFGEDDDFLFLATSDPLNYDALEAFEKTYMKKPVKLYISLEDDIKQYFMRLDIINKTQSIAQAVTQEMQTHSTRVDEHSSVMKLIELIIKDSIMRKGSDIHIEPDKANMSVRVRIDGMLVETFVFTLDVYSALNSRIKLLANLDISERRKPQDGRFHMAFEFGEYDFRLSTTPTMHGESLVMRILDQQKILFHIDELGFENRNLEIFNRVMKAPYGIVLVTGPTGSGKTTTLYAALNEVKSINNKVMTIEDPVEYQLPLIQQVQVNEKVGFTFFDALKSFLRQDPDIILVGEIRDIDTLNAASQASLTGHLVFSTLHTNDAPSAIGRMVQMGLQPYLIADALIAIVAQRLVRTICPHCKSEVKPHHSVLKRLEHLIPEGAKFYMGKGCAKCNNSGYKGRTLISEILEVNEPIAKMISAGESKYSIAKYARENEGFEPMVIDGLHKAMKGVITIDEVLRVAKE